MTHWSKDIYGRKAEGGETVKGVDTMEVRKTKAEGRRKMEMIKLKINGVCKPLSP